MSTAPVLVIDDTADIRDSLVVLLEAEGFLVVTAENGREALELLRGGLRPCLIVLDLTMPVMNGFEFRYEQRRDPAIADIPVIVTSAVSDPAEVAGYLDAKAYIQKPAEAAAFVALVRLHCLKSA